jgi:hypothetical protein
MPTITNRVGMFALGTFAFCRRHDNGTKERYKLEGEPQVGLPMNGEVKNNANRPKSNLFGRNVAIQRLTSFFQPSESLHMMVNKHDNDTDMVGSM